MIHINNRDKVEWQEGLTVSSLLERMRFTYPHIVVTVDGVVVPPDAYDTYPVHDGANVRAIHLVAGG